MFSNTYAASRKNNFTRSFSGVYTAHCAVQLFTIRKRSRVNELFPVRVIQFFTTRDWKRARLQRKIMNSKPTPTDDLESYTSLLDERVSMYLRYSWIENTVIICIVYRYYRNLIRTSLRAWIFVVSRAKIGSRPNRYQRIVPNGVWKMRWCENVSIFELLLMRIMESLRTMDRREGCSMSPTMLKI